MVLLFRSQLDLVYGQTENKVASQINIVVLSEAHKRWWALVATQPNAGPTDEPTCKGSMFTSVECSRLSCIMYTVSLARPQIVSSIRRSIRGPSIYVWNSPHSENETNPERSFPFILRTRRCYPVYLHTITPCLMKTKVKMTRPQCSVPNGLSYTVDSTGMNLSPTPLIHHCKYHEPQFPDKMVPRRACCGRRSVCITAR